MRTTIAIGLRNRIDAATVSGGSWLAGLPAANVQDPDRSLVARSSNNSSSSTRMDFDFGDLKAIRAIALCGHNLGQADTWRVTLGTTSGGSEVWDSSAQAAWYLPFTAPEEWEAPNWWGLPFDEYQGHPYAAIILAPQAYQARYMRVQLNVAGSYAQVARLWAGDVWQPELNAEYGLEHGWVDPSTVDRTLGGGVLTDKRRRYRTARMSFPVLSHTESDAVFEIQRRAATVEELLYLPSVTDYQLAQRYGFVGRMSDLPGNTQWAFRYRRAAFNFEEWI